MNKNTGITGESCIQDRESAGSDEGNKEMKDYTRQEGVGVGERRGGVSSEGGRGGSDR